MARQGSAFNGMVEGDVIMQDGIEYETAPAAPPAPAVTPPPDAKKQPMTEVKSSTRLQARPIPVPQRDATLPHTAQTYSSRRAS